MKVFIHYTVWNKETMIQWLAKGIQYCIPEGSHIDFILDNCTDNSKYWVERLGRDGDSLFPLNKYVYNWYESSKKYRWQNTNDAIERFMQTDCDIFLSPQDDQKIQDSNIIENLERVYNRYGVDNTGIIGMRDGITDGHFWSAHHSLKLPKQTWLAAGEAKQVDEINDGPICLHRSTIEKVGLFDVENFTAFYTDRDYSIRCKNAGLYNYVMGAEIVHEKWGNVCPSELYTEEISKHDWDNFLHKYPTLTTP